MHPAVAIALRDWREYNSRKDRWASLEMFQLEFMEHPRVVLTVGVIHGNGFKECALMDYTYVLEKDGTVRTY